VRIDYLENRINLQQPHKKIQRQIEKLKQYHQRILNGISLSFSHLNGKVIAGEKQLINLGPKQVMDRGYSIAYNQLGEIIRNSSDIKIDETFTLKTGHGSLDAQKISNHSTP
jgi:exodeoxyribonuclease VII large subunit